ncbi:MAG: hypothetical protein HYT87_18300 [Nitrospirae bacterium]|nr:hypothetical protein [Nitrospirota bacterium]
MQPIWIILPLLIPPLGAAGILVARSPSGVLGWVAGVVAVFAAAACGVACTVFSGGPLATPGGWLRIDALSAFHHMILSAVFLLSSVYARLYFHAAIGRNEFPLRRARQFGALWLGALTAITLVLTSNNLGLMWVGLEATTLMTAFLISLNRTSASLEAMWKYLVMCSVGVAFAFMGTLLVGTSARGVDMGASQSLLWTDLVAHSAALSPTPIKVAFLFLLVGYGTKAGIAPLHGWLPDAHSQAPAPVSAMFSGFLLSTALYCIARYLPIVEGATGHAGWSHQVLIFFGSFSIAVAAVFIVTQQDVKRLLAYSSVEHIGIIALGLGLGPAGAFAAMFHTLNHSLGKCVAFFSAGRLGQEHGSYDLDRLAGASRDVPAWGTGLYAALLALVGLAPFATFMSEFQVARAAVDQRAWAPLAALLVGLFIVLTGALRLVLPVVWAGKRDRAHPDTSGGTARFLIWAPLGFLLILGIWMPAGARSMLEQAAAIVSPVGDLNEASGAVIPQVVSEIPPAEHPEALEGVSGQP